MPKDTPLHKAANQGDVNACKELITSGEVEVNQAGAQDRTALQRAVGGNHIECAKALVELGADINQVDKSGRTPLHWAAIGGHAEAVEYLLDQKAEPNKQTSSGATAFFAAVEGNRIDVVKVIIAYNQKINDGQLSGATLVDYSIPDSTSKSAYDIAKEKKLGDMIKVLKEGAGVGAGDKSEACIVM